MKASVTSAYFPPLNPKNDTQYKTRKLRVKSSFILPKYTKATQNTGLDATFHVGDLGSNPLHERYYLQQGSSGKTPLTLPACKYARCHMQMHNGRGELR